jgi:hypothetical protein
MIYIIIARRNKEESKILNKGENKSYLRDDTTKVILIVGRTDNLRYADTIASGMYVYKGQDTCSLYPRRCTVKAALK